MIGILFARGGDEVVELRIEGDTILWRSNVYGTQFFPIDSLYLEKDKVMHEYPDLKECAAWKDEAMKRLKDEINMNKTETAKAIYIVSELQKIGYQPHSYQKQGFRTKKWDGQIR